MGKDDKLTISQCSRLDLLWVINRVQMLMGPSSTRHYIDRALNDLWYEKQKQRINEAERVAAKADAKRREYIELMKPYEGKRLIDVPIEVINRSADLLNEAREMDEKWEKLMGF